MITRPTTFVVGAGASNNYGLPTSAELRQEAHNLEPRDPAYKMILATELCTTEQLNAILEDLRKEGTSSIDEFLFARQDDEITMRVGRALIALLLGRHFTEVESPDSLDAEPTDWLGYIIKMMRSGARDCETFVEGNAEVRFVTFNFDSIIEDRLEKVIRNFYLGTAGTRAVSRIHSQIIHVHGRLPPPPEQPLPENMFSDWGEWTTWLSSAPPEIRVVMDQIDGDTLAAARKAVRRSAILCFLGFAYANDNLARLDLPAAIDRGVGGEIIMRNIFGTAFGMRPGETAEVKRKLAPRTVLGGENEHCCDFLRNHHILRG